MTDSVNPQLEDVYNFHNLKAERGELKVDQARLRVTALRALVSVLGEDEPRGVKAVLDNLDGLINRWANKHPELKGGTAQTYGTRARAALEDYLRWQSDPAGFRFNLKEKKAKGDEKKVVEKTKVKAEPVVVAALPPPVPPPVVPSSEFRSFPLGPKGVFKFELPEQPLKMRDVHRIALHLATFAEDFDPRSPLGSGSSDLSNT